MISFHSAGELDSPNDGHTQSMWVCIYTISKSAVPELLKQPTCGALTLSPVSSEALLQGVRSRMFLLMKEDKQRRGCRQADGHRGTILGQALARGSTLSFSKAVWEADAGTPIYTHTTQVQDSDTSCS